MAVNSSVPQAAKTKSSALKIEGNTEISDDVIEKVIGVAVRDVNGVYAVGGSVARAVGAIRERVISADLTQGVSVEVGDTEVAVDITVAAEYPVPLHNLADAVRQAAGAAIVDLIGMSVAEINVTINDVHFPGQEDDEDNEAQSKPQGRSK